MRSYFQNKQVRSSTLKYLEEEEYRLNAIAARLKYRVKEIQQLLKQQLNRGTHIEAQTNFSVGIGHKKGV